MLQLSKHLIILRDGSELLVADRDYLIPVHLKAESAKFLSFLEEFREPRPPGSIPTERLALAEVLVDIGILKNAEPEGRPQIAAIEALVDDLPSSNRSLEVHLLISQDCNLACTYCYNGNASYRKKRSSRMQFDTAIAFVNWLAREVAQNGGLPTVHFFGGEPMLGWRTILAIANEAAKRISGLKFYITTNLSILPNEFIDGIEGVHITFDVTVDGPEAIHNRSRPFGRGPSSTFQVVTRNVKRLTDRNKRVFCKMVLGAHNDSAIEEAFEIHKQLGSIRTSISLLRGLNSDGVKVGDLADPSNVKRGIERVVRRHLQGDWVFDHAAVVQEIIRSRKGILQYCGAGADHSQVVDDQGNVFDCAWTVGRPEFRIGYVEDDRLVLDWERDVKFKQLVSINHHAACLQCSYRYTCGGPCPATRFLGGTEYAEMFDRERRVKCAVSRTVVNELLWHAAGRTLSAESPRPGAAR